MYENVGRKLVLIVTLFVVALLLLLIPKHPIPLGLDLAGGVRLVYRLDFAEAQKEGAVSASQSPEQVLEDTIAIIRTRADPNGVLEPIIRRIGTDRIEIQLPGTAEVSGNAATATVVEAVAGSGDETTLRGSLRIQTADARALDAFPGGGGVIEIDKEQIRYSNRVANELQGIQRAENNTVLAAHAPGAEILLVSDDQIRNAIENLGDLRFYIAAGDPDFQKAGTDRTTETTKVSDWLKANPQTSIKVYNGLAREAGGPPPGLAWFPRRLEEGEPFHPRETRVQALAVQPPEWTFVGESLERVYKSSDRTGFPAVGFEMRARYVKPFTDFTTTHVNGLMAIVLNDEIATMATINEPLPGQGQISGRFTDRKVDEMVNVLRSGSLKIKPKLESREEIGATVGKEYVDQGWIMGVTVLGVIILYMVGYFRVLGVYASIALIYNIVLQLGALAAFRATLTMPGIAGIILGIGMAVDANILIFERIREEQDSGKKPLQAAKAGFENAMSAIIDSNVTTILAGLILYYVGTGPIRGFAVTVTIGVLTSMFAALVVVRTLLHFRLKSHPDVPFKMGHWLAKANFNLLGQTRWAIGISAVLMVAGLALFAWLPNQRKFGIDFLGGASAKVRTEQPLGKDAIEAMVKAIPGDIGRSAEVAALPASKVGDAGYTEFRVTFKTDPARSAEGSSEETFKNEIRRGLANVLQKGPIDIVAQPDPATHAVQGTLYFSAHHPAPDIAARLAAARLVEPKVDLREGRGDVFTFSATVPPDVSQSDLPTLIRTAFFKQSDTAGQLFELAEPIPEASVIGRRVVGELRDSALKALLLSMLVTVIYLRVRFAEYSFGIAGVVALLHDILITVGAIAFLVWIPWIHVEFDMGTIAVFLTIVGYSINDTIIVFDRIRENRPRMKGDLREVVNTSINQTFSRTIMTSSTAAAAMLIVLLFNFGSGNVLEGFAFTMFFGITTGTFSSIWIASPILVWLEERAQRKRDAESKAPKPQVPAKAVS